MLLPHGFEGQGPEHSSARIERFLTLCAENNMRVANCTTPAQYFHLLRRQMYGGPDRRGMRKPLVIFTPKSLLRHPQGRLHPCRTSPAAASTKSCRTPRRDPEAVTRVVFCSGKIYYDLLAAREERKADHVALVRVEQLYPFAADQAREILNALSEDRRGGVGAGRAAEYGPVALHARQAAAGAGRRQARTALCGTSRMRPAPRPVPASATSRSNPRLSKMR